MSSPAWDPRGWGRLLGDIQEIFFFPNRSFDLQSEPFRLLSFSLFFGAKPAKLG